ncbi:PRC-barrel domain-containing protein [Aurantimonas sp. NFXS3]|uniref:PRC-barrel domain-containing protein n=1 Tax=Aurantimonas sp. NFXS3 TaxID=2818434 RepID=UPI003B8B3577
MREIFIATLLAGSALSGAAFAQTDNVEKPANAEAAAPAANVDAEVEADVVVQPDAPAVKVDVPEPDVKVNQADPNVTVSQPQPTITVNQPAPTITVDIPQPTITVRMPEPNVNVDMAQPEVSVSQGEPKVSVGEAGNAAVETAKDSEQANVTVDQANANVQVRQSDQRPKISYQSEDAKVTVNQEKGEPKIIYQNADGSPMDGSEGANAADPAQERRTEATDPAATQQQPTSPAAGGELTTTPENQQSAAPVAGDQPSAVSDTDNATMAINPSSTSQRELTVQELTDYDVISADGDTLGDIEQIVEGNGRLYAVIGSGGFLGLGEKQVAIPLSSLVATDRGMIAPGVSEGQIDALDEFDPEQYPSLENEMRITVGQQ